MVVRDKAEQEKGELIARYIERNPDKPAVYDARLNPYGVSVWVIVSHFETVNGGNLDRAASEYDVPREAIEAALAFYERYRAAIDAKIEGMRASSVGWDERDPWGDSATNTQQEYPPEMNDERFEQLRRDPRVVIHQKKSDLPFVPFIRVNGHIDVLELIGRREPEDEPDGRRGA